MESNLNLLIWLIKSMSQQNFIVWSPQKWVNLSGQNFLPFKKCKYLRDMMSFLWRLEFPCFLALVKRFERKTFSQGSEPRKGFLNPVSLVENKFVSISQRLVTQFIFGPLWGSWMKSSLWLHGTNLEVEHETTREIYWSWPFNLWDFHALLAGNSLWKLSSDNKLAFCTAKVKTLTPTHQPVGELQFIF